MDIERIIKIIEELDDLSNKFSDNEVIIACYLSIRYGTHTCKYYIDNTDLDKIHKEISKRRTLFDKNLNYRIDKILNNSSEEDIENKKFIQMCISKIEEKQSRKLNAEEMRLIKTVAPIMRLTATEDEN